MLNLSSCFSVAEDPKKGKKPHDYIFTLNFSKARVLVGSNNIAATPDPLPRCFARD